MADAAAVRKKTAVVTGGTSGIGHAIVEKLLAEGYLVIVLARDVGKLVGTREGLAGFSCDVSDPASVARASAQILVSSESVDALVNCAGVTALGLLEDMAIEEILTLINVNLLGVVHMTRVLLPALKKSQGSLINLSSGLASHPRAGRSVYSATKGAIESFTRSLAIECGPSGVRVNAVAPSVVRTEIWRKAGMNEEDHQRILRERGESYPLGRIGEPSEVADAVCFLISDSARWITGVVLAVDGGSGLGVVARPSVSQ